MKRCLAFILALCLVFTLFACETAPAETTETAEAIETTITLSPLEQAVNYFLAVQGAEDLPALYAALSENAGESGADWTVTALALAGQTDGIDTYGDALEKAVVARYETEEKLSRNRPTEWHRIALCFHAMGRDPRNIAGIDLVRDGVWNRREELSKQGPNALCWALLLLSASYEYLPAPDGSAINYGDLVKELVSLQQEDGGWALGSAATDVDLTAMAITALSQFPEDPEAIDAVDRGLDFLAAKQLPDGGFQSYGKENAQSTAWVIVALNSVHMDPARFQKDGGDPVTALLSYQRPDGGFAATETDEISNKVATYQAILALTAQEKKGFPFGTLEEVA